jgi:hypothetical protein
LDATRSGVSCLLRLGRLSGTKQKHPRRAGKSQWLVDPASVIPEEKRRKTKLVPKARGKKRISAPTECESDFLQKQLFSD